MAGRARRQRRAARAVVASSAVLVALAALLVACSSTPGTAPATGAASTAADGGRPDRPNILLVLTDDQRLDEMAFLPRLSARTDWARFDSAFVEEPMCCPSRATILTGRYAHHTGVDTLANGENLDESRTVATMLHDAGYATGFFGKYLNGYPFDRDPYVPPGWDTFVPFLRASEYYDYELFEDGAVTPYGKEPSSYSSHVLVNHARRFVESVPRSTPFFVSLDVNAPHFRSGGFLPLAAPPESSACLDVTFTDPPNLNQPDTVAPVAWMADLRDQDVEQMAARRLASCQALHSLDRELAGWIRALEDSGRLEDTYVVFTSDNGFSYGEHQLMHKGHLYEESIRVPLLVRGPGVRPGPVDRLTSNVDLAPTMLAWAEATAPDGFFDGRSFAARLAAEPGAADPAGEPTEILLYGCRTPAGEHDDCGGHSDDMGRAWGVRTRTHKLVSYPSGEEQLFDLVADPFELANRAADPAFAEVRTDLRSRLDRLRGDAPLMAPPGRSASGAVDG